MDDQLGAQWIYQLGTSGPKSASIQIKANPQWASTVTGRMEPYKSFPNNLRPALEAVAEYYTKTAIPRTFKSEGPGWRPLSKRTQMERARAGFGAKHPILIRKGDLFSELTDRSHPKHVEIIKTGTNARVIVGGSSEKFVRNQLGNQNLNIPSRPMLPGTGWLQLNPSDDLSIRQLMTQRIMEQMKHAQL